MSQPPGYEPQTPMPQRKTPGLAIASLVCGIAGFPMIAACFSGIAVGIVGAVLGHIALKKIRASNGTLGGEGMAKAGMICGYISAGLGLLILIAYLAMVFTFRQDVSGWTTEMYQQSH